MIPGEEETDWNALRKCPICAAETGQPCLALSGLIAQFEAGAARPDQVEVRLDVPHRARVWRKGYVRE